MTWLAIRRGWVVSLSFSCPPDGALRGVEQLLTPYFLFCSSSSPINLLLFLALPFALS
jgi:hypothetical protein